MDPKQGKIVLDPIYGIIELDALAVKIIDTECFQRLRHIQQLSFADFVYPGATHTRFVHSIGVYHLACEMIKVIDAQPLSKDIRLSEDEKNCIRVAALCHDLGHGPFSHGYEEIFKDVLKLELKHEHISQKLVKTELEKIPDLNKHFDGDKSKCIELIQALIEGNYDKYSNDETVKKKKYMFQIVSNKTSGVDVDKWDYFKRDARACGVPETFQYDRALRVARVVKPNKDEEFYELGYRDEDAFSFYNMFNTRLTMYRKVYYHKATDAVGLMIKDIFQLVNDGNNDEKNPFDGKNLYVDSVKINLFPIETFNDGAKPNNMDNYLELSSTSASLDQGQSKRYLIVDKYLSLRNDVLLRIGDSTVAKYKKARDLIQRLRKRKLYTLVGVITVSESTTKQTQECSKKIQDEIKDELEHFEDFKDDVEILKRKFNYGQGHDDPVTKIYFYQKDQTKNDRDNNEANEVDLEETTLKKDNASESATETQQRSQKTDQDKNEAKYVALEGTTRKKDNVSFVLTSVFEEHQVRVYEKFSGKEIKEAASYREEICKIIDRIREKYMKERQERLNKQ